MIKIISSYSKKVPADMDYSSQSFMASVETEIAAGASPSEIQRTLAETFDLVKDSVETEIGSVTQSRGRRRDRRQNNRREHGGERGDARCTNKQVKFILSLGEEQGLGLPELNRQVADLYGAGNVYDLSKRDASAYVDVLKDAA